MPAWNDSLRPSRLLLRWHTGTSTSLKSWVAAHSLLILGILSLPLYAAVLVHGDFRPRRMEPFFPLFLGLFLFYGLACWVVLRSAHREALTETGDHGSLSTIFLFAIIFNLLLIPSRPTLSDDMYRYIWDGRVQAAGINPYQYPSNAPELAYLRDSQIWRSMNRPNAVTIYPPGAQMVFAATWRVFPDSVAGMKLVMIAATLLAGWLLVTLLRALGQPPERVLIFLWSPLLVFEIAHSAHVDALYLPLIVGAFWLRVRSPSDRVRWRHEAAIGVLLGLATLVKLYPVLLVPCLWSLRDSQGKRRWRLALPVALGLTILLGYALYIQPGVNTLGFLSTYGHEFFNISPHMRLLINLMKANHIPWYIPGNYGMPLLVGLVSLWFVLFPAQTPRQAVLRCFWPIGIYLLINHNLFSWYILWLLPLIALALETRINAALAWWVFTGTIALSYTFFIAWKEAQWGIQFQFWPLYILLLLVGFIRIRQPYRLREQT
jgi:hypothetical protein